MINKAELLSLAEECKFDIPQERIDDFLEGINDIISFVDTIEMNQDPNVLYGGSRLINVFRKDEVKKVLLERTF